MQSFFANKISLSSSFKFANTATATLLATALEAIIKPFNNSSLLIVNLIINSFLFIILIIIVISVDYVDNSICMLMNSISFLFYHKIFNFNIYFQ